MNDIAPGLYMLRIYFGNKMPQLAMRGFKNRFKFPWVNLDWQKVVAFRAVIVCNAQVTCNENNAFSRMSLFSDHF